jgi:hypothetical protein
MRAPTEEEFKLLRLVAGEQFGTMSQEDNRLDPFCDMDSTLTNPDTFNRCCDLGWLHTVHDQRLDSGSVTITKAGSDAIAAAN